MIKATYEINTNLSPKKDLSLLSVSGKTNGAEVLDQDSPKQKDKVTTYTPSPSLPGSRLRDRVLALRSLGTEIV